jgi:hypothetical protein
VAACINRLAKGEGYDYQCSATAVARWREADARQPLPGAPPAPGASSDEEGHAYVVLRQLVFLLGKEGTKKLTDSL